jgi:hypothetical protein
MRAIVVGLTAGQITPSEATAAIQVIETCRRVAEAAGGAGGPPLEVNIQFARSSVLVEEPED